MIYTSKYDFKQINDSTLCTKSIESTWLDLTLNNSHRTYTCAFYRPPDGLTVDSIDSLTNQLHTLIDCPAVDIIMCGNANIDLNENNRDMKLLKDFLKQHNLIQKIQRPTQILYPY